MFTCMHTNTGDNPFLVHCYNRHDNLAAVCVTDRDYPTRVVYSLISKTMNEYEQKAGMCACTHGMEWRRAGVSIRLIRV